MFCNILKNNVIKLSTICLCVVCGTAYAKDNTVLQDELKITINDNEQKKEYSEELYISTNDNVVKDTEKLNFQQILEYTFNNNDSLNAEREKTKAVETLKFKTLGKNALPVVGIDLNYGYTDFYESMGNDTMKFEIDTDGELMNNSIYLSQPIFKSGRTVTQLNAVKNQIAIQKSKLYQTEQETLFNTIYAVVLLSQNKAILEVSIKNEESLKKNYEYVKAKKNVGRISVADVALAEARYNVAKTDTITARANYQNAKANFYKITKIDADNIDVDYDKIFEITFNYDIDYNNLLEKALINNPQYQMAKYNYEMNKDNLNYAKTNFLPEIYLNAQYGKQKTSDVIEQDAASVSLNLKIPLFQSGVEYATHKEAGHLLNESKFTLNDVKETLNNQTLTTYDDFISSKSLVVSTKSYRDAAKIAYENTVEAEKVGRLTIVDVLNRRKEYYDAEVSLLKTKTNNIMSYFMLKMLMGELNLENIFIK